MTDSDARIRDLERRLSALETRATAPDPPEDEGPRETHAASVSVPDLRRLDALRRREGPRYERDDVRGALTYAGSARFGDREVLWAGEHGLPEIWDLDPVAVARLLAALGHPTRLALVRALITGARTSQELQVLIGGGSPGQLYHHLKDLISAGVVDQSARSHYQIAAARVVPLLVVLSVAGDVARPHDGEAEHEADPDRLDDDADGV